MSEDRIYAEARTRIVDFAFDETVASVFPDMIRRSVPGYADVVALTGLIAGHYAQPGTFCYDLGCSLGAVTLAMRRRIRTPDVQLVAIDNAEAMIARCRENVDREPGPPVTVACADIREVEIRNASVVALNFTLQFVPPAGRLALLQRIRAGMAPGGVLVLSEKVVFADPLQQQFNETMHLGFKRANGYSSLEISQKRTAIENVLVPDTLTAHQDRLAAAGFARSDVWYRCLNFVSLVAFA
ncbi:MAG: carboxy-S-adenosyl-L-methionine synthase CmoA [Gammaproteobacteria bacterium]|nr:carboxy-S-adenosyl-L-methionine synthase CmoA [Gammaproteobacteria bacterium]